jgi:predicted membrane protein
MTGRTHAAASLLMMGMSAGFVHGLGMRPNARLWRLAFSPWTA